MYQECFKSITNPAEVQLVAARQRGGAARGRASLSLQGVPALAAVRVAAEKRVRWRSSIARHGAR